MLAATAATQADKPEDSSGDSDAEAWEGIDVRTGDLDIVHKTLTGMAKRSSDEGAQALGRHARTIRLGRSLWQSQPLSSKHAEHKCERFFDDGTFPPLEEVNKSLDAVKKLDEARPAPFAARTQPFIRFSINDYNAALDKWLHAVAKKEESPTPGQFEVQRKSKYRVMLEIRLQKEGILLRKAHPERAPAE